MLLDLKDYMLPCLSKTLFGLECLGCGFQRSFILLIHGDFIDAFKMYPAVYTLLGLFIFILINFKVKYKHSKKIIARLAYLNLFIMVINYLLKINI
ncbi:DUF2752 domain-containing protein [Polaribacter sp.]|uniref:DUF2752 domain-containing protein n=1 Tax=Polaribacter sp. TaxID=1920175 RepID=UPI003F6B59F1